jgi:hypothetical protein
MNKHWTDDQAFRAIERATLALWQDRQLFLIAGFVAFNAVWCIAPLGLITSLQWLIAFALLALAADALYRLRMMLYRFRKKAPRHNQGALIG